MTYHVLSNDTGQTPERRAEEAHDLIRMLEGVLEELTTKESDFVESMDECEECSPKQLFWLRDLKDKYL